MPDYDPHGITDADVVDAPRFQDIAGDLLEAIAGCVVAAYNVYFDMRFLQFEFSLHGVRETPPHICLMYLRPLLGLGKRCRLVEACHGVRLDENHLAGADVIASGQLLAHYLDILREQRVTTFADLADCGTYKFLASLGNDPFAPAASFRLSCSGRRKSRLADRIEKAVPRVQNGLREYWDALKVAVTDLQISEVELQMITEVRERHQLKPEQIRVLHARAFVSVINQFVSDQWLDDRERAKLHASTAVCRPSAGRQGSKGTSAIGSTGTRQSTQDQVASAMTKCSRPIWLGFARIYKPVQPDAA
jgi:DNA polymerase-3 subunit epsilon